MGSFYTACKPLPSKTMKTAWILFAIMAMIVVTNAEFSIDHSYTKRLSHSEQQAIKNFANRAVRNKGFGLDAVDSLREHLNTSSKFKRSGYGWSCFYSRSTLGASIIGSKNISLRDGRKEIYCFEHGA